MLYFGASAGTEDTEVTAQLLNRLLCCFDRGWHVTFNLQLCSLFYGVSAACQGEAVAMNAVKTLHSAANVYFHHTWIF